MRNLAKFVGLVALLAILSAPRAWAIPRTATAQSNQRTMVFRNVSSAATTSGSTVIFDVNDSNRTIDCGEKGCGSDAGYFVETTTSADSTTAAGVQLSDTCLVNQDCVYVVEGPAYVRWAGSTDNTNSLLARVGTTTVAGQAGSGTLLGFTLSGCVPAAGTAAGVTDTNCKADNERKWIWVHPEQN